MSDAPDALQSPCSRLIISFSEVCNGGRAEWFLHVIVETPILQNRVEDLSHKQTQVVAGVTAYFSCYDRLKSTQWKGSTVNHLLLTRKHCEGISFEVIYSQFHPAPARTQSTARQTLHQLKRKKKAKSHFWKKTAVNTVKYTRVTFSPLLLPDQRSVPI